MDRIIIKGAREHNLKNIDIEIPRGELVVITGLSGSGKSSLAFDTIYAEGQRRYVESLSAYARQFLEQMEKPDVDSIEGLSPAISIEQKTTSRNPRSTVATITEIYDYLRLLFARVGHAFCYNCGREITQQSVQQIVDRIMAWPEGTRLHVLAPIVRDRKGEYKKELSDLRRAGFVRAKIDGKLVELGDDITLNKNQRHTIDVMVDRLAIRGGIEKRLADSLEVAFKYGEDLLKIERLDGTGKKGAEIYFSQRFACVECGISYPEITPRMFSFNSPHGACTECSGIGSIMYFDPELVVQNEDLSISDGAIAPWATINYMQPVLESLAGHYKFSLDTPWKSIPAKIRKAMLNGSGDEEIEFNYQRGDHNHGYARPFEGVLLWLDRRYKETESESIREVLEAYMNMRPCPSCNGARLKKESLFVRFNGKSISEVTAMSIKQALAFFERPKIERAGRRRSRRLILKEIRERLELPRGRRPRLSHARSHLGQPFRRRGPAHPAGDANRFEPGRRALYSRRTVDRLASARQSTPAGDAQTSARTRQFRDRRRARSRHHGRSGPHHRYGSRRGHPRRLRRRARHARRDHGAIRIRSPASICRAKSKFRCRRAAARSAIAGSPCAAPSRIICTI